MCSEHESILLDGEDVRLKFIEDPRYRHYLNYTSDSAGDMSRKMC